MRVESNAHHNFRKYMISGFVGMLTLSMIMFSVSWWNNEDQIIQEGQVLGLGPYGYGPGFTVNSSPQSDQVEVTATVVGCFLYIHVYPEKRIPQTGNWSNEMLVNVYDSSGTTQLVTFTTTANSLGYTPPVNMCTLLGGTPSVTGYILRVKGLSHLRQRFPAVTGFGTVQTLFDLVPLEPPLLAGETSIVFDNFINGLDLSTQVNALYTGNIKNDLNRDGQVNSLDLSNTIFNLYLFGEN